MVKKNQHKVTAGGILFCIMAVAVLLLTGAGKMEAADRKASDYGKGFFYTDSQGIRWNCRQYQSGKAVITGVSNAPMEIAIPAYVYDEGGAGLKVVGVVSPTEISYGVAVSPITYNGRQSSYMLLRVDFPDSVEFIGERAFRPEYAGDETSQLQVVNLPQNPLLVVEKRAFEDCTKLQVVNFTAKAGTAQPAAIESQAFKNCISLKTITFPTGSTLAYDAFEGCWGLESAYNVPGHLGLGTYEPGAVPSIALSKVTFAEGLEAVSGVNVSVKVYYGDGSYTSEHVDIPNLKEIVIPGSVKTICGFGGLTSLQTVSLPDGLEEIESDCFCGCTGLRSINLPAGLKKIGSSAFENCRQLTGISSLPAGIQEVDNRAFLGCTSLTMSVRHPQDTCDYQYKNSGITDITFPAGLHRVYGGSFTGCPNLKSITVPGQTDGIYTRDGVLYATLYKYGEPIGDSLLKVPAGMSQGGRYEIPANVKGLGGFTFEGCHYSEIVIPTACEALIEDAMYSVDTPDANGNFPTYHPFDNMASVCKIYYDKDVLDDYADSEYRGFGGAAKTAHTWVAEDRGTRKAEDPKVIAVVVNLGDIYTGTSGIRYKVTKLPDNSNKNGTVAAIGHTNKDAGSIQIDGEFSHSGITFKVTKVEKNAFAGMKKLTKVTIQKNVTAIGDKAFANCPKLKTVTLGTAVTAIGGSAFLNCPKLAKITLPKSVKTVGTSAFAKCTGMKTAVLGTGVTKIGKSAFSGDKALSKITIQSAKLKSVGKNAFKGIAAKAKIKVPKKKLAAYKKLLKGKGQGKKVTITS